MEIAVHLKIHGKVQGVFFRQSAKKEAGRLGLVGWVMNHGEGHVEAFVQGKKAAVEKFVKWCSQGPDYAKVTKVDVEQKKLEEFSEFSILS